MMADTFKIVRTFLKGGKRTIHTGLTLEEARAHCGDPETSSSSCTSAVGKRRTREKGPWMDGYDKE